GVDRLGIKTTPLRRMTVGMFVSASSFVVVALLQHWINYAGAGGGPFLWQVVPYVLLTVGEGVVSVTGLGFAYTPAPRAMKSTVMSFWNLTVSLGNVLVALITHFGGLPLAERFWVFAALMAAAGVVFGIRAYFYKPKDYAQG